MRNLIYLALVFLSLTLMNFSCEQEEPLLPSDELPVANEIITLAELEGHWTHVSYKLSETDHNTFTTCEDIDANPATYDKNYYCLLVNFTFYVDDANNHNYCETQDMCFQSSPTTFSYFGLSNNKIIIGDGNSYIFIIKSYNKITKILTLVLESEKIGQVVPLGGIYTIKKQ